MSQVFALASEFIERMSNPAYGIRENEDYAMRFGTLLASEGFESMLRSEIAQLNNPESLSPHGWLWLLNWARSEQLRMDGDLLLHLTEVHSSVFMQAAAIDTATRGAEWAGAESVPELLEFRHPWLRRLLRRCVETPRRDESASGNQSIPGHIDMRACEAILVALMQVGTDVTLDAASALLNHEWVGQSRLLEFYSALSRELDAETREQWLSRLHPPSSQGSPES